LKCGNKGALDGVVLRGGEDVEFQAAAVGDGATDQGVQVAVSWLATIKAVSGRDLGGAHRPPLPDGVRRLTDVHNLSGIGYHRVDALRLGWRWGQNEGDKGTGAVLIELDVLYVIKAKVRVFQERGAIWAPT